MKKLSALILALILACGMINVVSLAESNAAEGTLLYYIPGVSQFYHADIIGSLHFKHSDVGKKLFGIFWKIPFLF